MFLLIFLTTCAAEAQDFIFFSDSPSSSFYDPSFGTYTSPSLLELSNTNKFPVDINKVYAGMNSLRLKWTSRSGGDWGIAVASAGWVARDITTKDTLRFMVYSENIIDSASIPLISIEDANNIKAPKQKLSAYLRGIQPLVWTKVAVPLDIFKKIPGSADMTKIKTIYFYQSSQDGLEHTIYIDEIKMTKGATVVTVPPSTPASLLAKGYARHIDVKWNYNTENNIAGYKIYKFDGAVYKQIASVNKDENVYCDFVGQSANSFSYTVTAFDSSNTESAQSHAVTASTKDLSDNDLLDMLQESTFRYFWDYAHPVSGLSRERRGSENTVTSGGSGFGVMAILCGIERGFITRRAGAERILKISSFLAAKADRFHGVFPHWLNGSTGKVIPFSEYDNGGDVVETAFLIQGLLTARSYFDGENETEQQIRALITGIWEDVDWNFYRQSENSNYIYWHWSPNYAWKINMPVKGDNETMIVYLLASASPSHSVPASLYKNGYESNWDYRNGNSYYGIPLFVGQAYGGPLFFAHYSFLGFDPRNKKDSFTNYFINNKNRTLINRAYCIANSKGYTGYSENLWGLTASDNPDGYSAQSPSNDNGTITPSAALSSMPYTPEESMAVLKNLYYNYGTKIWGAYGFVDAFNLQRNWYASSYLAIDQGPIIDMVENYRSQLLWNCFMKNPEIQTMLSAVGFTSDTSTSVSDYVNNKPCKYTLYQNYPNPFNGGTVLRYQIPQNAYVSLKVYDQLGRETVILFDGYQTSGSYKYILNAQGLGLASGVYYYRLKAGNYTETKKLIYLK
jgi:hypothetical protein